MNIDAPTNMKEASQALSKVATAALSDPKKVGSAVNFANSMGKINGFIANRIKAAELNKVPVPLDIFEWGSSEEKP